MATNQSIFNVQVEYHKEKYLVVPAVNPEAALDAAAGILADWKIPREKLSVVREREFHDVVGRRFTGPRLTEAEIAAKEPKVFLCVAWDWRTGFWMRDEATGEMRSVSERAPGRTFHLVRGADSDDLDAEEETASKVEQAEAPEKVVVRDRFGDHYEGVVIERNGKRVRVRWVTSTMQYVRWFGANGKELRERGDSEHQYKLGAVLIPPDPPRPHVVFVSTPCGTGNLSHPRGR
jgi:hypothetical protein